MTRLKLIVTLLLAVVVLVFALQNTNPVDATFLVARVSTPLTLIVLVSLITGFVLGVLVSIRASGRKKP